MTYRISYRLRPWRRAATTIPNGRMRTTRAHCIARGPRKAETLGGHIQRHRRGFLPVEGSGAAGSWGFVCVCIYKLHLKALPDTFALL